MNDDQLRRKAFQVRQEVPAIYFVSSTKLAGGKSGLIEEIDKRQRAHAARGAT